MNTDRDYSDMVDPFVAAEKAAWERGFDKGVVSGILYAIGIGIVIALVLFASKVGAADWDVEQTRGWHLPKASERGARIVVCGNNAARHEWRCFVVKGDK